MFRKLFCLVSHVTMKKERRKAIRWILPLGIALLVLGAQQVIAGPLPGAIFTTLEDGSRVNHNIYEKMEDVYLDGGPGQNAPSQSASLPEGDYYFQVTDPSGKKLLSEDAVKCREFHVNEWGVIDYVYLATCLEKVKSKFIEVDCTHFTGIDEDHSELDAITVQLMPYKKTPNKGGVYKVWVTPVERFVGDPEQIDNPSFFHGFVPAWSKTDNYKVRRGPPPPVIRVRKFLDLNANGIWDEDPLVTEITGWYVDVTDQLLVTNRYFTPAEFIATEGLYTLTEEERSGWQQTALIVDQVPKPPGQVEPTVQINVLASDVLREVIFGNIPLGSITACKFHDLDADGINDGEPPMEGILFMLDGTDVREEEIHLQESTGEDGCVTFADLYPGNYTLSEVLPEGNWVPTTDISVEDIDLPDGEEYELTYEFGNIRLGSITACKFYDLDADGNDDDEPPVEGILFMLDGTDVRGEEIHLQGCTGEDGCVTFADLYPGNYTLSEVLPGDNWEPTTNISEEDIDLPDGEEYELTYKFGNFCFTYDFVDFSTKGYWHNKNGIGELTSNAGLFNEVLSFVNSLNPYDDPTNYFSKGDEPFDGMYEDSSAVQASKGVLETIAPAGSVEAEISHFLVNSNSNGWHREQLAQQLLAFIFNAYYRVGSLESMIEIPSTSMSISDLIDEAVEVWTSGTSSERSNMSSLLDWFNNNNSVQVVIISSEPCEFEIQCP